MTVNVSPITIQVFDGAGQPNPNVTPSILLYLDRDGNARDAPAVMPAGAGTGAWVATPTYDDAETGCVALIDGGAGVYPRYRAEAVYLADNSNQFWAWVLVDALNVLWIGDAPEFDLYVSVAGLARTAPDITALTTYLFCATPTEADIATGIVMRVLSPTGAQDPVYVGATEALNYPHVNVPATPGLSPEGLAISSLREYLLQTLPAKCDQLNLARAAELKTPGIGPFTITTGTSINLSTVSRGAAVVNVPITTGTRTAAQVAADITAAAVPGLTAEVDGFGHLSIQSDTPPDADSNTMSVVQLGPGTANEALGFDPGGEHVVVAPLRAPTYRGVCDGAPKAAPDMGQGFWVILGERQTTPFPDAAGSLRRDEYWVAVQLEICRPEANVNQHRSREAITACVRAIREVLSTVDGRQLGRASAGDIVITHVADTKIYPTMVGFDVKSPNALFDVAEMTLGVKVYQRPTDEAPNN